MTGKLGRQRISTRLCAPDLDTRNGRKGKARYPHILSAKGLESSVSSEFKTFEIHHLLDGCALSDGGSVTSGMRILSCSAHVHVFGTDCTPGRALVTGSIKIVPCCR